MLPKYNDFRLKGNRHGDGMRVFSKRSLIGNSDIASMLARRLRGHVPLRAASPQHGCACVCLGFSFAGSCHAAGCKPAVQLENKRYLGKSGQDR